MYCDMFGSDSDPISECYCRHLEPRHSRVRLHAMGLRIDQLQREVRMLAVMLDLT